MVYNFSKKDTLLLIDCSIGFLWKKKNDKAATIFSQNFDFQENG